MPHRRNQSDGTNDSRRKFLKASGAGAVALSLAGCSGGGSDTNQDTSTKEQTPTKGDKVAEDITRGGTFVYGMAAKPDTSNILTSSSVYAGVALYRVYEFGNELDPVTQEVVPNVFTDWTIEKGDKPSVYFNMRDGLKWNDGEDFTKEDVLFTYRYCMENKPGNYASIVDPMEKIAESSKDKWDFRVDLSKPIGYWESDIVGGLPLLPKHKWEGKDYKKYNPMEANDNGPVGLGPGHLTKFDPDTSMQVVFDHDNYFETLSTLDWKKEHDQVIAGGPFLDKINFKVYGSRTAMTNAFLQGGIDTHYGSMKTSKMSEVKKKKGMKLVNGTSSGFSYFGFNVRRKPLDDVGLKQAMSFMFDEHFWIQRLQQGYAIKGDFAQTPGYAKPRPDYQFAGKDQVSTHPATNAFDFRNTEGATPDIKAVRKFLTSGQVIDGSSGTYAGKKYPGSLSGISASQSKAKYDYTFGPVKSKVLKDFDGADKEIRVDGKTIPEVMDGDAITMFIDPPKKTPKEAKAIQRWVDNLKKLGIPVKTQALSFNTMSSKVYYEEDFDIYPMGWGGTGPFGSSAYSFFHSDQADDLSDGNEDSFMYNSTGYGLSGGSADDLLSKARTELDPKKRNKTTAKALEKIYLDMPYYLMDYAKMRWPVNNEKFGGFISNLVDPPYASFGSEINNIHLKK
ncbi:ABC transporter substrate-binding protein [Halorussus gelatinilyticus]|uniref:ABC transporter substrate-binding protein n=1 Tax=Halorussus gelatinilyticus TaxID=2937524 RepID=A0A8U0IEY5_9EURY|nr:ABC transporter substrate-binding protein [Halorussus gelatinilyticus]UPV99626.1 ABC transporter substrate-binding protein [Halorussus gelatinilyticus]